MYIDLEQAKLAATLAMPFIKELVEKYISPNVKTLIDEKIVSVKMTSHSFENQFSDYLRQYYEKFSTINIMALSNQKRMLKDIYVPLRVVRDTRNKEVYLIDEFAPNFIPKYQKVLVIDTAGMGKSTMVKRLFLAAVEQCVGVPMIIELRRLNKGFKIMDEIFRQLSILNQKVNEKFVLELIIKGGFVFMLDGFDEIENEDRKSVIEDIRNFIDNANGNYFMLTSRREDALGVFNDFVEFNIDDLYIEEAYQLIGNHDDRGEVSSLLIKKIENREDMGISEFLANPLLVSLLYAAFEYKQAIPLKKHMFYRQVYDAFFERHDLTKGESYTRIKNSKLESDDFSRVLRYIGYYSMLVNKIEFTKDELLKIIEDAKKFSVNLKFNALSFVQDLLTKVPLFIADGLYLKWAHKSIQEYFAANFIFFDSGLKREAILVNMTKESVFRYRNVIDLYYDIDYKSFRKYVIYECLKSYLFLLDEFRILWPDIKESVATVLFCEIFIFIKYKASLSGASAFEALESLGDDYAWDSWGSYSAFNEDEERYNNLKVFSKGNYRSFMLEFFLDKKENFVSIGDERRSMNFRNDYEFDFKSELVNLKENFVYVLSSSEISRELEPISINRFMDRFYFFRKSISESKAKKLVSSIEKEIEQERSNDFLMPGE